MIDKIKEILNTDFKTVIATQLSYDLIKTYSILYKKGEQVRTCVNSQLKYYNQLKEDGIIMANKQEETKRRTAIPAWNGRKYFSKAAKHFDSATITDAEILNGLEQGYFKEHYFEALPIVADDNTEDKEKFTFEEENCIKEFQDQLTQGLTKNEIVLANSSVEKIGTKKVTKKLLGELIAEANKRNEAQE